MTPYTSCETLPLENYINCIVDRDLNALIKTPDQVIPGVPPVDYYTELQNIWIQIQTEFLHLSEDTADISMMAVSLEADQLGVKIELIGHVLQLLQNYFSPLLIEVLKSNDLYIDLDPDNETQYYKNLARIATRSKKLIALYNDKVAQLKKMQTNKVDTKIDRMYFYNRLGILSKFMGYEISEKQTTVGKYISVMNLFSKHCEELNSMQNVTR